MPAIYDSPQTLTLVSSNPWPTGNSNQPYTHTRARPKERQIHREVLLDVAPDRENLFFNTSKIEELRKNLKLHVMDTESHWLYRHRKRTNISLKDANPRISTLIRTNVGGGGANTTSASHDGHSPSSPKEIHVLRRVLSSSAVTSLSQPSPYTSPYSLPLLNPDPNHSQNSRLDIWSTITLSTTEKLISPRPLGPTHILILHSAPGPSRVFQPGSGAGVRRRRVGKQSTSLSSSLSSSLCNVVEAPINDLLFVLNVPNLARSTLPSRLHKELPRVVMCVPHLDTFPELVVYLHTQNQAELFRRIVPEWIRDLLHPLPELVRFNRGEDDDGAALISSHVNANTSVLSLTIDSKSIAKAPLQLIGRLIPLPGANSTQASHSNSHNLAPVTPYEYHPRCTPSSSELKKTSIMIAAEEIARAAAAHTQATYYPPHSPFSNASSSDKEPSTNFGSSDPIAVSIARLNALRDNLEYIGYFAAESLWYELDVYREVLIRALSCRARVQRSMILLGEV